MGIAARRRLAFAGHVVAVGRHGRQGRHGRRSVGRAGRAAATRMPPAGRWRRACWTRRSAPSSSIPRPRRQTRDRPRSRSPRGPSRGCDDLGQKAELHGLPDGRMTGHHDRPSQPRRHRGAGPCRRDRALSRSPRRAGFRPGRPAGAWRHDRLRRASQHQDRIACSRSAPDSPIAGFLARNPDGGIHHLCYEVDDIDAASRQLAAAGTRILGSGQPRPGAHGKPVLFLHPKDFFGTLIELEQA